jgi:hypothetical protein
LGIVDRDVLIGCINYHSTPNISDLDLTLRVIASYKERLKTSLPPNVLKQLNITETSILLIVKILHQKRYVTLQSHGRKRILCSHLPRSFWETLAYLNAPYVPSEEGYVLTEHGERMGQRFEKFLNMACQCDFEKAA